MNEAETKQLLEKNPQLDLRRIEELQAFQERMEKAGLDLRTQYRLEPAFGSLSSITKVESNSGERR